MKALDAYANWLIAVLDGWTASIRESTAAMEEREYWRGYTDALADVEDIRAAEEGTR